ncbi:DegV family protein [Acetivibrio sp. MSJd-27]|uniref:DegV family protein n=1 Tax=Acetivibrio sp. MSJd-27 TaxID=2841523 RepID=UPI001C12941E|nr:DegV family protein [Acetivibrio sp. MSJd-27]MBU5449744.1 DegV family protein [Acetivibrio sp. MSJd-27]
MEKIKIITDSASDVTADAIKKYNIEVLPFTIVFPDGSEYLEQVDITYDEFYDKLSKLEDLPTTSQVTAYQFEESLKQFIEEYDSIIIITISSVASNTHQNAVSVVKQLKESGVQTRLEIVDSMTYTGAYGAVVTHMAQMASEGKSTDEILQKGRFMLSHDRVYAVIDDLKYLKKSGRIKPLTFTLGSLLDIKPIITVEDGLVAQFDKVRGVKKAAGKIIELAKKESADGSDMIIFVGHSTDNGTYASFYKRMQEEFPKAEFVEGRIGSTIGVHCGTGVIVICMIKKC